jgi:hypothetical protein
MNGATRKLLTEIDREPRRRPYAARIDFFLGEGIQLSLDGPASLLAADDAIVGLDLAPDQPLGPLKHLKRYRASIEGFATASHAEAMGLKLALALLWSAITKAFTMRLDYHAPLPCVVYDRSNVSGGISFRAYGSVFSRATAADFADMMRDVLATPMEVDRRLLLSMELFSAARLEVSDRAKFLGLVSSLEPLAFQAEYPNSVLQLIDSLRDQLQSTDLNGLSNIEASNVKASLDGRLQQLRRESIRQALLRVIRELFPGDEASVKTIDGAYALRSEMLHHGTTDPYLDRKTHAIEQIIRRLYAKRIGKPLRIP